MGKDSVYHIYGDCNRYSTTGTGKGRKIQLDDTKHYPNKDEAALLRKLMAETGLSEEEVRSYKKYRIMLSEAAKGGQKGKFTSEEKFYRTLIKNACKETGLVKEHPDTIAVLDRLINEKFYNYSLWWGENYKQISAKKAIELYGKKRSND